MLAQVIIIGIIVERVWEYLQLAIGEQYLSTRTKIIGAVLLSLTAAIVFKLDFLFALEVFNAPSWPGYILTGFVLSMGSHVVHDLFGVIKGVREDKRPLELEAGLGDDREV